MNVFYLSHDPHLAARWMVDKHIVKMPLESCQMLSTAHRLLDGRVEEHRVRSGISTSKPKKFYLLRGEKVKRLSETELVIENQVCYYPTHVDHPSTQWTMASKENYEFHVQLLLAMTDEYARRYGRTYKSVKTVVPFLMWAPNNLRSKAYSDPVPAMPECYKVPGDVVESYRNYYAGSKWRFAKWKHGQLPPWFLSKVAEMWDIGDAVTHDERQAHAERVLLKRTPPAHPAVMDLVRNLTKVRSANVTQPPLELAQRPFQFIV